MALRRLADRKMQRGFSLLELLIALVVFSVGLLAIAGLQTVSKQANYEGLQRTTAAQIANGLLEEIRTNGDAVDVYLAAGEIGEGSRGNEPVPNCSTGSECNSAQNAAHDLWVWEQMLDGTLETNAGAGQKISRKDIEPSIDIGLCGDRCSRPEREGDLKHPNRIKDIWKFNVFGAHANFINF